MGCHQDLALVNNRARDVYLASHLVDMLLTLLVENMKLILAKCLLVSG